MQVYRFMDIGTAKPSLELRNKLPHHLIDLVEPNVQFCAGDFVRLADEACEAIQSRGKCPVILGGTAFYIKNFLYGLPHTPQSDPLIRSRLLERLQTEGSAPLYSELLRIDPESAARINRNDDYRIVRALEVYNTSGRALSSFAVNTSMREGYRFTVVALTRDRVELYDRIEKRVDDMLSQGLEGEFLSLMERGYTAEDPGMQAIGYREFFQAAHTAGSEASLGTVRELIVKNSKKYAKRQETFIRSIQGISCIHPDDTDSLLRVLKAGIDGLC